MSIEHKMDLKVKLFPWQQHSRCHFVSYQRYIIGAKFEQHHHNIFRDILDFVIYFCTDTICETINFFEQKLEYLWNERRYSKEENAILALFERRVK